MQKVEKGNGFTLIELIVVIAVLSILAAIAVPRFAGYIDRARIAADQRTVNILNTTSTVYGITKLLSGDDIFEGFDTDQLRMEELVDKKFLSAVVQPKFKGAEFVWLIENQLWVIYDGETMLPLSPLGSSFVEISSGMISLINQRYIEKNSYGRTWGDYSYTDIGLDPEDWKIPVAHILYKPGGSTLRIRPEDGYSFIVKGTNGDSRTLSYSLKWDLVYDAIDDKWYYHSISDENSIDISTLEVKR